MIVQVIATPGSMLKTVHIVSVSVCVCGRACVSGCACVRAYMCMCVHIFYEVRGQGGNIVIKVTFIYVGKILHELPQYTHQKHFFK